MCIPCRIDRPILATWLVDRFGLGDLAPRRMSPLDRLVERLAPSAMPIAVRIRSRAASPASPTTQTQE